MNVLHLNHSDTEGGAARAAYRLHKGLLNTGVDSMMLVGRKSSSDPTVLVNASIMAKAWAHLAPKIDGLPLFLYRNRDRTDYSLQWFPNPVVSATHMMSPGILHLHWICEGFLRVESFRRFAKPFVWTLHDMWPFTGGCHYSRDCTRYTGSCGSCPLLHAEFSRDISRCTWNRKVRSWRGLNLTVVAPSHWLANCAKSSSLFSGYSIRVIPNGLDLSRFKPIEKTTARRLLTLPQNKYLVSFGAIAPADNPRKGFSHLLSALQYLKKTDIGADVELVLFGSPKPYELPLAGFKIHNLGRLGHDLLLALAYSASDVFIAPSLQDNLANTVMEALACGTPTVAFNIGGMPDMINHKINGYLAQPWDIVDIARGIGWILEDEPRRKSLSLQARLKAEKEYDITVISRHYAALYDEIVDVSSRTET